MNRKIWCNNFRDSDSEEEELIPVQVTPKTLEEILILEDEQLQQENSTYKREMVDIGDIVEEVNVKFIENPFAIASRLARMKKMTEAETENERGPGRTSNGFPETNLMKNARKLKAAALVREDPVQPSTNTSNDNSTKAISKNPLQAGFERQAQIKPPARMQKKLIAPKPKLTTAPVTPAQFYNPLPSLSKSIKPLPVKSSPIIEDSYPINRLGNDSESRRPKIFTTPTRSEITSGCSSTLTPIRSAATTKIAAELRPLSSRIDLSRSSPSPAPISNKSSNQVSLLSSHSASTANPRPATRPIPRRINPFDSLNNSAPRYQTAQHPLPLSSYAYKSSAFTDPRSSSPLSSRALSPIRKNQKSSQSTPTRTITSATASTDLPSSQETAPLVRKRKNEEWTTLNSRNLIPTSSFYGSNQAITGTRVASLNSTSATSTRLQPSQNPKIIKKFVSPFRQPIIRPAQTLEPSCTTQLAGGRKLEIFTPNESLAQFKARKAREVEEEEEGAEEIGKIFGSAANKFR